MENVLDLMNSVLYSDTGSGFQVALEAGSMAPDKHGQVELFMSPVSDSMADGIREGAGTLGDAIVQPAASKGSLAYKLQQEIGTGF